METSYLEISGSRIAYSQNKEDGIPVLFIHGNNTVKETFSAQFEAPELQEYRLICLDNPGHGQSAPNSNAYRLSPLTELIKEFCSELKIEMPYIVGHSLGGHVAIHLSQILETKGLFLFGMAPVESAETMAEGYDTANLPTPYFSPDATDEELSKMASLFTSKSELIESVRTWYRGTDSQWRISLGEHMLNDFHSEMTLLNNSKTPTFFFISESESLINNEIFFKNFSKDDFVVIESSSHFTQIENTAVFNQTLSEFLDRTEKMSTNLLNMKNQNAAMINQAHI